MPFDDLACERKDCSSGDIRRVYHEERSAADQLAERCAVKHILIPFLNREVDATEILGSETITSALVE